MANKWPSHFHHLQKWAIDLLFKIIESANTWQILRSPLPTLLLCRHHKCMFPFWFFKVWSVTCLNANEILNFMKIQSSYLLSSYQRNQASLYFQLYQLLFEQLFGKFMSVTIIYIAIRDKIFFLKCNWWKSKIKIEIKVNEEYIKGTKIFVFEFLFFTIFITYIDDLKINAKMSLIDILLIGLFFRGSKFSCFLLFRVLD